MRIVVELTNRCNLSCQHCFAGRHGGSDDLPLTILDRVLTDAKPIGFDELAFTGGDPTVHPAFADVVQRTAAAGYDFSMVTNGWNFTSVYPVILGSMERLRNVTFSMDGATESSHDGLRGAGSFRRVLKAMSVCMLKEIPFTINMVVTAHNRSEIEAMVELATKLGSRGLRFGHLMPSPRTTQQGADLSPTERRAVETEIRALAADAHVPVAMAPGYHTTALFPCTPLQLKEVNIDCHGNLTKCCHLSGHGSGVGDGDVIGSLAQISFTEGYQAIVAENARFQAAKEARFSSGHVSETDYFPCWYCSLHYQKVDWLRDVAGHPWARAMWDQPSPRLRRRSGRRCRPSGDTRARRQMTENGSAKAVPHPDTLFTELKDGAAVLLNLETHAYYGLNATGTRIWQLMTEAATLDDICATLAAEFEIASDQARDDVEQFTSELTALKLVNLTTGCDRRSD